MKARIGVATYDLTGAQPAGVTRAGITFRRTVAGTPLLAATIGATGQTVATVPVPRVAHLLGTAAFGVLHAFVRTTLIMLFALPFFDVDLSAANWGTAMVVMLVGSVSLVGLGVLAGVLPMVYPERGE